MSAALLAIWNRIAPDRDAAFNAWYEDEHLAERLALPGFRSARRYRDADDPYRYCVLYELDSPSVLQSPAYLERLAHPTPRTRALMPSFSDVSRAACRVAYDSAADPAPRAWLAICGSFRAEAVALHGLPGTARVRLAAPDEQATGGITPEQQLRAQADRVPPPFGLLEADDRATLDALAAQLRDALGGEAPRVFMLIAARSAHH